MKNKLEGFYSIDNEQYDLQFENIEFNDNKITVSGNKAEDQIRKWTYLIRDGEFEDSDNNDLMKCPFKFTQVIYNEKDH